MRMLLSVNGPAQYGFLVPVCTFDPDSPRGVNWVFPIPTPRHRSTKPAVGWLRGRGGCNGRQEEPLDSASDWVAEHTRRYVESGGEDGHYWRGVPTLVLTTRAASPATFGAMPSSTASTATTNVVVASKGGDDHHPLWYLNLLAEPKASIQVGADIIDVTARTATPDEKALLWPEMVAVWGDYASYQEKTERDIPVVILTRR